MENEEKKEEGKSCCPCGKSKCCCKAFGAVALLVVGGIGGYFAGRHCALCAMKAAPAEVGARGQLPAPGAREVRSRKADRRRPRRRRRGRSRLRFVFIEGRHRQGTGGAARAGRHCETRVPVTIRGREHLRAPDPRARAAADDHAGKHAPRRRVERPEDRGPHRLRGGRVAPSFRSWPRAALGFLARAALAAALPLGVFAFAPLARLPKFLSFLDEEKHKTSVNDCLIAFEDLAKYTQGELINRLDRYLGGGITATPYYEDIVGQIVEHASIAARKQRLFTRLVRRRRRPTSCASCSSIALSTIMAE